MGWSGLAFLGGGFYYLERGSRPLSGGRQSCGFQRGGRAMYLKSDQRFAFVVLIRCHPRCFPAYDTQFHMLNLQPDEQEVYPSDDDIFQMILALRIFEFDV